MRLRGGVPLVPMGLRVCVCGGGRGGVAEGRAPLAERDTTTLP